MRVHPSQFRQSSFYWQMPVGLLMLFGLMLFNFFGSNAESSVIEILVAKKDLPKGTAIKSGLFERQIISRNHQVGAVTDFRLIQGCFARGPIAKGSSVTAFLLIGNCKLLETDRLGEK